MTTQQKEKKKYPYTKRLVKLASEHGWRNADIAEKAGLKRTSVAQVTKWLKGESLATERQMAPLIKEFGDQLKRKIEHLFYGQFQNDEKNATELRFYKLSGEPLVKFNVRKKMAYARKLHTVSLLRIIILQQNNLFHLVNQYRAGLSLSQPFQAREINHLSHSCNEDANWFTYSIDKSVSAEELLRLVDQYADNLQTDVNLATEPFNAEANSLKFIVRQALLKQGIYSDDIIDLVSQ